MDHHHHHQQQQQQQQLTKSVLLNNQAIDLLKRGEHLDAIHKLTWSLHMVKDIMTTMNCDDENDQDAEMDDEITRQDISNNSNAVCAPQESLECRQATTAARSSNQVGLELDPMSFQAVLLDSPLITLQKDQQYCSENTLSDEHKLISQNLDRNDRQDRPFIYNTPLLILPSVLSGGENTHVTPELLSELSVALMFNLALCHHMRALHADTTATSVAELRLVTHVFHQAVSLYELAYEVQMQEEVELSVECSMAIVNNLGRIHQRLGNAEKAARCFSHLLSTLLFVQTSSSSSSMCSDNDEVDVSKDSIEGFLRNVSDLILSKKVAAAA